MQQSRSGNNGGPCRKHPCLMQDASDGGPPNAIQHLRTQKESVLHAAVGLAPSHSGLLSTGDTGSLYNRHSNHVQSHGIHQQSLDGKKGDFLYTGNKLGIHHRREQWLVMK